MTRIYIIAALAVALVVTGLGGALYIETLKRKATALQVENHTLFQTGMVLRKQLDTNAAVQAADNARADKAEAALKSFKETADADIAALKSPDRLCFDGDDTRRLQHLFGNEVR